MTQEETNGGRHSSLSMDFFRIDPVAWQVLAGILYHGAVSHQDSDGTNWRRIPATIHVNHALYHLTRWLAGDAPATEDHLGHAFCRLHFALAVDRAAHRHPPRGGDVPACRDLTSEPFSP